MKGIVIELQEEALKDSTDIEELLRKAYLISKKLKLEDFEKWTRNELDGYKEEVPDYRIITGDIRAMNPYVGWIPVIFQDVPSKYVNTMPMNNSIASIVDTYSSCNGTLYYSLSSEMVALLNRNSEHIFGSYSFKTSKSELKKIISAVRNKILEWALLLEENGITGEGLSFSEKEIGIAQTTSVINNFTNNFYGDVDNSSIDQGNEG